MGNCNDGRVGGARHHRRCCNWDDFLLVIAEEGTIMC